MASNSVDGAPRAAVREHPQRQEPRGRDWSAASPIDARIASIAVAGLRGATPRGGWSFELAPHDVVHTLLAIHTDQGVTGLGSAFTTEALVKGALEVLAPMCLGESALEPERVTEKLHQSTFWLGRGGAVTHAISAIDIALWDILGQVTGQPVRRLLGGSYRDRVRPYASLLADGVEPTADRISELVADGFRAFKIGWGMIGKAGFQRDEELVAAARNAAGDDALLMVDAGGSDAFSRHDLKWALRTSRMLAQYGVHFFEEPLPPDALKDYSILRKQAPVLIAGGEVLTGRQSFACRLARSAFDIVQPDVTKVGGLSESRRIGWIAESHGARLIPHGWNTAVGFAADLQLAAALHGTDLVELHPGASYISGIMQEPPRLDEDGMVAIPNKPGLGISLDMDALARYVEVGSLGTDRAFISLDSTRDMSVR